MFPLSTPTSVGPLCVELLPMILCVCVCDPFVDSASSVGHPQIVSCFDREANRDGGWGQLPGLEYVKEYDWDAGNILPSRLNVKAKIYCKNMDSLDSMDIWEGRQNFPPTKTKEFVHGLCAIGFESVSATSDYSILTYEPVEEWNDEERLWLDRNYVEDGSFCKGGTTGNRRDGGWGQLPNFEYVKTYDWDASNILPVGVQAKIYCKTFRNDNKDAALDEGINLKFVDGSAEYASGAVKIVSQDSSTVTVELRQAWASPVDKYSYQYKTNAFTSKCFEEDTPGPNALVDTITIQCHVTSPFARLKLCLQDTTGDLLDPVNDQGTVSKCCHSDAPLGTPTVCYTLEIDCADNTKRSLRGLSRRIRNDV